MNWKLLVQASLLVCAFFNLFWVAIYGSMVLFGEQSGESPTMAIVPGLSLLCGFVVPSSMVGTKAQKRRFVHGLLVGCVGWTLGMVVSIPTSILIADMYYRGAHPSQLGQAHGILIFVIWAAGVITSPGMGVLAAIVGGVRDRRRAKL